jgi:hypothetical protein
VIDQNSQRIFVSDRVNPQQSPDTAHQEVVALDVGTGQPVLGPVEVSDRSSVTRWERSRASLLLQSGAVYVAFAARCEDRGMPIFHGFVFRFNENTLNQAAVFRITDGDLSRAASCGPWRPFHHFAERVRAECCEERFYGASDLTMAHLTYHRQSFKLKPVVPCGWDSGKRRNSGGTVRLLVFEEWGGRSSGVK